ncbi:MAG: hypothetical protein J3R72DRAFT_434274 [Linnemannia gamsii]|nr:MAG: hypothetical protein J3R72DRAFT_434274 [Linnemannia gamsii]
MPGFSRTSHNHHFMVSMPIPTASSSSSSISSWFQSFFPDDPGDNNDPFGIHHLQANADALQQPDPAAIVNVNINDLPLPPVAPHQRHQFRRHRLFWTRFILAIAKYLCPTFMLKPTTPLRLRMTLPIVLHLVFAFAIFLALLFYFRSLLYF